MPDRHDGHDLPINPITDNVAGISKVDWPIPVFLGQTRHGTANEREFGECLNTLNDRSCRALGGGRILWAQEITQPLDIPNRLRGEDQSWHRGAGCSSSVPQLSSHVATSSRFACMPVA